MQERSRSASSLQERIALGVAERVVDDLEPVEVEVEQRELARPGVHSLDAPLEDVAEQRAVGEPGEVVVRRAVHEAGVGLVQLLGQALLDHTRADGLEDRPVRLLEADEQGPGEADADEAQRGGHLVASAPVTMSAVAGPRLPSSRARKNGRYAAVADSEVAAAATQNVSAM